MVLTNTGFPIFQNRSPFFFFFFLRRWNSSADEVVLEKPPPLPFPFERSPTEICFEKSLAKRERERKDLQWQWQLRK